MKKVKVEIEAKKSPRSTKLFESADLELPSFQKLVTLPWECRPMHLWGRKEDTNMAPRVLIPKKSFLMYLF
jgi:hypothetical protein